MYFIGGMTANQCIWCKLLLLAAFLVYSQLQYRRRGSFT